MLKPSEREKLQDCILLVQSARDILTKIRPDILPDVTDIQKCFIDVDRRLTSLLRS